MGGVLTMVNLDLLTMKPYVRSYLIVFAVAVFMAFSNVGTSFMSVLITIYLLLMSGSIFSVQEKSGLDRLYSTLSIDGKTVVLGRYIFILLHGVVAVAASYIISTILALYRHQAVDSGEFVSGALLSIAFLCLLSSIQLPLYYRLGYTKARFVVMMPFLLLAFGVPLVFNVFPDVELWAARFLNAIQQNMALFVALGLVGSILLFIGSYYLSLRMRRRNLQG